jgi:hypothetical protein
VKCVLLQEGYIQISVLAKVSCLLSLSYAGIRLDASLYMEVQDFTGIRLSGHIRLIKESNQECSAA